MGGPTAGSLAEIPGHLLAVALLLRLSLDFDIQTHHLAVQALRRANDLLTFGTEFDGLG